MADLKSILGELYKDGMTVEEIASALSSIDIYGGYIKKDAFDKTASEVAKYKKELSAHLSEEELRKQKDAEERSSMEEKYTALLKESNISKNKAKFLGIGYDEALASETAEALINGDMEKVFANQAKHTESREKAIRAQILNETPAPQGGSGNATTTKEQFKEMGYAERTELFQTNPTLFNQLNS